MKQSSKANDDTPLVVSLEIGKCSVKRMSLNKGSATNFLFWDAVIQMGIPDSKIRPYVLPLMGFIGHSSNSADIVNLPVQVNGITCPMEFLIIDAPSSYNGLIGWPGLNQFKAKVSTYSLTLEVRIAIRLFAIRGDHDAGRECFLATRSKME